MEILEKVDNYIAEKSEDKYAMQQTPLWTVVRVWRKVPGKNASDAIMVSKGTPHDEVKSVKDGKKVSVKG